MFKLKSGDNRTEQMMFDWDWEHAYMFGDLTALTIQRVVMKSSPDTELQVCTTVSNAAMM